MMWAGQIMRRRHSTPMIDRQWGVPTSLGLRIPLSSPQTLAAAEYLNFRYAANALSVNLSSVSARVKMLETAPTGRLAAA
jgi:hypothetical protein